MNEAGYLTNQLLIAMPTLGDENFSHSVTLICDHSASGALGLILNKPLQMDMGEIFRQLQIDMAGDGAGKCPVLRGGPVQSDRGFVVHRAGGQWESTLRVSEAIHVTTSRDVLRAIARGEGPEDAFLVLGYAGWESGQLEDEIRANAWITAPADAKLVFEVPFEKRWNAAAELLGVELSRISPVSGNA
jgi:putative transcriptional regulator